MSELYIVHIWLTTKKVQKMATEKPQKSFVTKFYLSINFATTLWHFLCFLYFLPQGCGNFCRN